MKAKILSIIAVLGLILGSTSTWAYDFEANGLKFSILDPVRRTVAIVNSNPLSEPGKAPQNEEYETAKFREFKGEYSGTLDLWSVEYNGELYFIAEIGYGAFANCKDISVNFGSIEKINAGAFWNCSGRIDIPYLIETKNTELGMGAFAECKGIFGISILHINSIGAYAFANSDIINIDKMMCNSIGYRAFMGCDQLLGIGVGNSADEAPTINESFDDDAYEKCTISCYKSEIDAYRQTEGWCRFKNYKELQGLGVNDVELSGRLSVEGNVLCIGSGEAVAPEVYNVSGAVVARHEAATEYSLTLPQGIYIVRLTTASGKLETAKIIVR